jgi:hypothetical protein
LNDSLPVTTDAPPLRLHEGEPASKAPPGASWYWPLSPHFANGWLVGCGEQSGADATSRPALALGAPAASATTAREAAMKMIRSRLRMTPDCDHPRFLATDIRPFAEATSVHRTNVHKGTRATCR